MSEKTPAEKIAFIKDNASRLMKQHGLENWKFEFGITKRTVAYCQASEKRIQFSIYHAAMIDEQTALNTILHEIAHALDIKQNGYTREHHSLSWVKIALSIGCNGEKCNQDPMARKVYNTLRNKPRR